MKRILTIVFCFCAVFAFGQVRKGGTAKPSAGGGHQYVDLGLSVNWATCNVGAANPWNYGDYFAWGETKGYKSGKRYFGNRYYKWADVTFNGYRYTMHGYKKYVSKESFGTVDNLSTLTMADDAARANWGGNWRMPTENEIQELLDNCVWSRTTINDVKGYEVTSKINKKSIFIPASGYRDEEGYLKNEGVEGYLWSSCLENTSAQILYWYSTNSPVLSATARCQGLAVRPVCPVNKTARVAQASKRDSREATLRSKVIAEQKNREKPLVFYCVNYKDGINTPGQLTCAELAAESKYNLEYNAKKVADIESIDITDDCFEIVPKGDSYEVVWKANDVTDADIEKKIQAENTADGLVYINYDEYGSNRTLKITVTHYYPASGKPKTVDTYIHEAYDIYKMDFVADHLNQHSPSMKEEIKKKQDRYNALENELKKECEGKYVVGVNIRYHEHGFTHFDYDLIESKVLDALKTNKSISAYLIYDAKPKFDYKMTEKEMRNSIIRYKLVDEIITFDLTNLNIYQQQEKRTRRKAYSLFGDLEDYYVNVMKYDFSCNYSSNPKNGTPYTNKKKDFSSKSEKGTEDARDNAINAFCLFAKSLFVDKGNANNTITVR